MIILSSFSVPQTNTGAIVGIAVVTLIVGVLAGVLLFCCIIKHLSKPESSSHEKQKAGPVYEEVHATSGERKIELWENVAYGPVQTIELTANEAYGHVHH